MQDGFLFDELSEFKKDILRNINNIYPDETKKFLKEEAKKINKVAKKIAKREVGTKTGNYLKGFKTGKVYKYAENDACIRAYNKAPHGHLIEYGHVQTTHDGRPVGFVQGKLIFKQAEVQFLSDFLTDAEMFMYGFVNKTTEGK